MKSWRNFLIFPLILLLIINTFFSLVNISYSTNSWLSITAVVFQCLSFIIVPFSMLRLAPTHPYIATTCYMSLLWALMYIARIYLNNETFAQQGLSLVWSGVFWTISAMSIYFFYIDPHFQHHVIEHNTHTSRNQKLKS